MAAAIPSQEPSAASSGNAGTDTTATTTTTVLRRAVYVKVSDLTSAYDIDPIKLEEELTKVLPENSSNSNAEEEEDKEKEGRANASNANNVDMDAAQHSYPQKRLQPPRGGFNLCV